MFSLWNSKDNQKWEETAVTNVRVNSITKFVNNGRNCMSTEVIHEWWLERLEVTTLFCFLIKRRRSDTAYVVINVCYGPHNWLANAMRWSNNENGWVSSLNICLLCKCHVGVVRADWCLRTVWVHGKPRDSNNKPKFQD